jgi:hypothetical protein
MIRPLRVLGYSLVGALTAGVLLSAEPGTPAAAAQDPIARYSAQVVNFDAPAGAATGLIQIQITRWSTDAERDRLTATLFEKGSGALLDVVSKMPSAGLIRTPSTVGTPLRYARRTASTNGESVVIITDRPLSFAELREAPRSRDYPFTVIRFQLNSQGQGQGDVMLATRIQADKVTKDIAFENFGATPIKLQNVRRE